jgi:hypothetical protein
MMLDDRLTEVFEYLDELRESGEANMFGASPYVTRDLGYNSQEARKYVLLWMETFDDESTVEDRVKKALNNA